MDKPINKFIAVAYKLYIADNGKEELVEEATVNEPFQFISGFGFALDDFEKALTDLEKGADFNLTLSPEQAYGEYFDEHVVDLDKQMFAIDGRFDDRNIFVGAVIPLQNQEGQVFRGRVLSIGSDKVKVDLNHPLAGKTLSFKGSVVENREATNEEIQELINQMSSEGCGCNCDDCSGCGKS